MCVCIWSRRSARSCWRKLAPVQIQTYYSEALTSGRLDGTGGLSAQTVRHHDRVLNVALDACAGAAPDRDQPGRGCHPAPGRGPGAQRPRCRRSPAAAHRRLDHPALCADLPRARHRYAARRAAGAALVPTSTCPAPRCASCRVLEQTKTGLRFKSPKTARSRRAIVLPSAAVEALQEHRVRQLEEWMRSGSAGTSAAWCLRRSPARRSTRATSARSLPEWRAERACRSRSTAAHPHHGAAGGGGAPQDRERARRALIDHGDDGPLQPCGRGPAGGCGAAVLMARLRRAAGRSGSNRVAIAWPVHGG